MKHCNVCSSNDYKVLHKDDYTYAICKDCGHVFQSDRKEAAHYHELPYESQWDNYINHSQNRANYIIDFLSTEFLDKVKKVVDIGSGPGGVLYFINKKFPKWQMYGITAPCDKDKMMEGVKANYGDFECDSFKGKYDLTIMCHVVEHFLDPLKSLGKVNKMLNKDGLLYIEVPSFHYAEVRSNPQFCPVHLSYFSKEKMIQLLKYNGFQILKVKESRYWGNLKIVAKKESNIVGYNLKENYIIKLIKWEFNKRIVNPISNFIKRYKTIGPNN
jgi:SAM-dependent methyltransferase